ncbi:MAG: hypothetical protein FWE55_02810, partial [Synergistaceae bacterium]|nr:hypothetical protein [Synergistaceae bacterium]
MSGSNRTQADDLIKAVDAVNELNKVWDKGRKRRPVNDVTWRRALSEHMEQGETVITPEPCEALTDDVPGDSALSDKPLPAEEIDGIMNEIRRLTDEPERLL